MIGVKNRNGLFFFTAEPLCSSSAGIRRRLGRLSAQALAQSLVRNEIKFDVVLHLKQNWHNYRARVAVRVEIDFSSRVGAFRQSKDMRSSAGGPDGASPEGAGTSELPERSLGMPVEEDPRSM